MRAILISRLLFAVKIRRRGKAIVVLCRSLRKHAVSREFVRVLHSNAVYGQPRSQIKSSKKEGEKWEIAPGDSRLNSRNIDPTGDRPYRYRPRGRVAGCTTEEIKGFLRSARRTVCAENFRVGFHYIYSENTTDRSVDIAEQRDTRGRVYRGYFR